MRKISAFLWILFVSLSLNAHPSRMYLIGDATAGGWSLDNASLMMTVSDGVYEWTGDLKEGELKFIPQIGWMPSYGPATNGEALVAGTVDMKLRDQELQDNDNKYAVTAGRWSLRVDLTSETPKLTVADGTEMPEKGFVGHYPESVYAIGNATQAGWSLDKAVEMKESAFNSGIYTAQLALNSGELKFLHQRDWGKAYGATVADAPLNGVGSYDIAVTDNSNDNKFVVSWTTETSYYVTVNAVQKTMTVSAENPLPSGIENIEISGERIEVYDVQGRRVGRDTEHLPAGLYIIRTAIGAQKIFIH